MDAIGQFVVGEPLIAAVANGRKVVVLPFGELLPELYGTVLMTSTSLQAKILIRFAVSRKHCFAAWFTRQATRQRPRKFWRVTNQPRTRLLHKGKLNCSRPISAPATKLAPSIESG